MRFLKILPLLYIFVASWTNAFALNPWLPINIVVLFVTVFFYIIYFLLTGTVFIVRFKTEDYLLLLIFCVIIVLAIVNHTSKTFNYILAYFVTYFLGYLFMKSVYLRAVSLKSMLNVNLYTIIFISVFGVVDFLLQILVDYKIQAIIPRTMIADGIYQLGIPRVYGLSEEPTYLAWYFNTLGIIACWWLAQKNWVSTIKIFLYIIILACYIFTFSGAGIPLMILFGTIVGFYYSKRKFRTLSYILIGIVVLTGFVYSYLDLEYIEPMVEKITFKQDNEMDRGVRWQRSISDAFDNPLIGKGLGYYSSIDRESPVNYFLFVFIELGVLPFLLILLFYSMVFYRMVKYTGAAKTIMLIGYLCGVIHLFTQSLFIHPCLWLLMIFFYKFKEVQDKLVTGKLIKLY